MAVLNAKAGAPVSLAYLDMNGLKAINDRHGHYVGDQAIKVYLQTIATLLGEKAEAFRGSAADEVVVVMRETSADSAREAMRMALKQLRKERVLLDGKEVIPFLTVACGIASTEDASIDAALLVRRADDEQKRAKDNCRATPGTSFLAVEGQEEEV